MKQKFNNKFLFHKWINLIISIYKGDKFYKILKKKENEINEKK